MKARFIGFGDLEIDGRRYDHDVVIEAGQVAERQKDSSRALKDTYGHTPLTALEDLPWGGARLIVGTGAYGSMPIAENVREEARRKQVELVVVKTKEACKLISKVDPDSAVHAVLHITC